MRQKRQLDLEDYQRAERLLTSNRPNLVTGGAVKPQWIGDGASFWYRRDEPDGHSFVLVEPEKGLRAPAFDHERLAQMLEAASGSPVAAAALPFKTIELDAGHLAFDAFGQHWRSSLGSYTCEAVGRAVQPNPLDVRSPDGAWAVSSRDHNLWVRSLATGEERQLTVDGCKDFAYGAPPDCLSFGALMRRLGLPHLPPFVAWSADSRRIVTHLTDQRDIRLAHLVESAPAGGGPPVLHTYRYAYPGDEVLPRAQLVVLDVAAGTVVRANDEPMLMPVTSPLMFGEAWWSDDGAAVFYVEQPRDLKTLWLKRLDAVTGEVRTLVAETGEGRLEATQWSGSKPNVRVISAGKEVVWYSQRDGWGHLYLYDAVSGELKGQITSGAWAVQKLLHVDEAERVAYFTASGLVESDVYRRQVCRVGLDGTGFARLGDDDLDHVASVAPNGACYVDSASAPDTPPVISVRNWRGERLVELERADVSRLVEAGWPLPERFRVKAADGETDIWGVLYRPHAFDPSRRYPVVDHAYPGPQTNRVQPSFGESKAAYDPESLATLGFVVIAVDGRGTPGRSKAFLDLANGHLDKAGFIEDHVAALRQLAETRPWMDLDRVGIFGASGGGYATVRAMCAYPEVYKAGVSLCGNHDQRWYQLSWGETYLGQPSEHADAYLNASNVEIAERLQGKLLLVHGEMDDNVHPQLTMRLVERLIAANKDFELLIVPGAEHLFVGCQAYVTRRRWDFFVRHLLGAEPPADFRLAEVRPSFDALFG